MIMKIPIRRQVYQLLMRIPVRDVKYCCKILTEYKIDYSLDKIEAHFLGGCDLKELAKAIDKIARAKINFELWDIMMLQLAGRNMDEVAQIYIDHNNDPEVNIKSFFYS